MIGDVMMIPILVFVNFCAEQCPDDDGVDYDLIWVQLLSFRESK